MLNFARLRRDLLASPEGSGRSTSLNRRELFQIDSFKPLLQLLRVLVLELNLKEISFRDHEPKRAVFAFDFVGLEAGISLDRDRLAVTFHRFALEIPRPGRRSHVVRIRCRIEDTDCGGRDFIALAFAVVAMPVGNSESA